MSARESSPVGASVSPDHSAELQNKALTSRHFLKTTTSKIGLSIAILGTSLLGLWLIRINLAEAAAGAFMRSIDVDAAFRIEKLQLGSAQIRDLTLGPKERPSLIVPKLIVRWRGDSKAGLISIEALEADDVTLRLAVGKDGRVDLGALSAFLGPTTGPKRFAINGVKISNATILADTPFGAASARSSMWGGEQVGWTGRAAVVGPAALMPNVDSTALPLRLGFALRQEAKSGGANSPATVIGFALRPQGQAFAYQNNRLSGVRGRLSGYLELDKDGTVSLATSPSRLEIAGASLPLISASGLTLDLASMSWRDLANWNTKGVGTFALSGTAARLTSDFRQVGGRQTSNLAQSLGTTRFQIQATRLSQSSLDYNYQLQTSDMRGLVSGNSVVLSGKGNANIANLGLLEGISARGQNSMVASRLLVPAQMRARLGLASPQSWPRGVGELIDSPFSGSVAFDYKAERGNVEFFLSQPLAVSNSAGARLSWDNDSGQTPNLTLSQSNNGLWQVKGGGSGTLLAQVPAFGQVASTIDAATFGPKGWAIISRAINFQTSDAFAQDYGISARGQITRLGASAGPGSRAMPQGQIEGRLDIVGREGALWQGSAQLQVQASASVNAFAATLTGPISGTSSTGALSGLVVNDGTMRAKAQGTRAQNAWQVSADGQINAQQLRYENFSARAPSLDLVARGTAQDGALFDGNARFSLTTRGANAPSQSTAASLDNLALTGDIRVRGTPSRATFDGEARATTGGGTLQNLRFGRSTGDFTYSGNAGEAGFALRGTTTMRLARLMQPATASQGQVDVSNLTLRGPFAIATGAQRIDTPLWNQRLPPAQMRIAGNFLADADRIVFAGNSLNRVRATLPVRITASNQERDGGFVAQSQIALSAASLSTGETLLSGLTASGPVQVSGANTGALTVTSNACFAFTAREGRFAGDATTGPISGRLCPDDNKRIATFLGPNSRVFATPSIEPLSIQFGSARTGQRIDLGQVSGVFETRPTGGLGLSVLATQFSLALTLPDGSEGIIKANEASLRVIPRGGVTALTGRLGRVSSVGLPVLVSGSADANMTIGSSGMAGTFNFDDIVLRDIEKSPRFGEMLLAGGGELRRNQITLQGDLKEPSSQVKMGTLVLTHDIATGSGRLALDADDMLMAPALINGRAGLDIVTLLPPLRGVVLDMVGIVDGRADVAWSRDAPLESNARIFTDGVDFETLLGPVSALKGEVLIDDLLKLRTQGTQTLTVRELNTGGIPVQDGTIQFTLPGDNSLRLENASWPFADGKLSVRPATWAFRDGDQSFAIDVDTVDLAKLLRLTDVPNLEIDGKVSGVFPIEVKNGAVEIVGGRLKARDGGGMIRYTGPNTAPPPPPPSLTQRLRERIFGKPPPSGSAIAVEALRALEYKILEITVDGRITGDLKVGVILEGANQQVLSGYPFKFNINMNVPIGQLLENVNRFNNMGNSPEVLQELDRALKEDARERAIPQPAPPPAPPPPRP